jgi:hypothetical protein
MSNRITLPIGMQLQDWADQVCLDLDSHASLSALQDPKHWQDWAVQFLNINTIGRNIPNPYAFKDWKDWAQRLCGSLT